MTESQNTAGAVGVAGDSADGYCAAGAQNRDAFTSDHRRDGTARNRSAIGRAAVRLAFFVGAVGLGFVLLEAPWSDGAWTMGAKYALPNLGVLALVGAIVYLVGQRTRAALAVFTGLCLLTGAANFFLITFKGQPIVPADLFALSTAASVSGGYSLFLTPRLATCIAAFAAFCVALRLWCPKRKITAADMVVNCLGAALLTGAGLMQLDRVSIADEYDVKVDVWDVRGSYGTQGTALCFLSRAQELSPTPPAGYSDEALKALLGPAPNADGEDTGPFGFTLPGDDGEGATPAFGGPNVIAIMNETFSDLSTYPGLEGTVAEPTYFHEMADDSLASGDVYVSAMGGGTCNSEFEFLTGASMGNMGGGVYPYVLYDLDGTENLASYFKALGYGTHAIHPAEASNWRRDRIYEQLGFDSFDDITTMEGSDTLRDMVTDKATYERVLEKIDEGAGPQFVFDVTLQNHGGYDTGLVPEGEQVHLESERASSPEVDEFLSCIKQSEEDLRWLVDELNARDEPTIVVFFGDHQPGFADWLFERTYERPVEGASLDEVQQRYRTPYFIWANEAAREQYGSKLKKIADAEATSLNYLGTLLRQCAGLPQTPRSRYLEALRQEVPAINLNGYATADGAWHWFGDDAGVDDALEGYRIVQYDQLFNKDSAWNR